jgi:glycosyltransferase involved in cell wall biosynthesis
MTITGVVHAFRNALPDADIYVYDNNSTDNSAIQAQQAGAVVRVEPTQGKGHVIRRAFADVEADIYIMVDGDATYPAEEAPRLIEHLITHQLDMVVGARVPMEGAYRPKHELGNRFFNTLVARLFGQGMQDIFSGYRIFTRRFVKSFPAVSSGFEIETELSVHALDARIPFSELQVPYLPRLEGSESKLNTYNDGSRILWTAIKLYAQIKPFRLFGWCSILLLLASLALGYPLIFTWLQTGLVPRIPTAIIVMGLLVFAFLSLACGILLEGVTQARRENRRLHYLSFTRHQ